MAGLKTHGRPAAGLGEPFAATPAATVPDARTHPARRRAPYAPLRRVLLTDGVAHTLFEEYAAHRSEARGDEETGWVLLGLREADEAVVLATLPAGAEADAGVAHVRFNSEAQAAGQPDRPPDATGA